MIFIRVLFFIVAITMIPSVSISASYPEFNGNYYKCGNDWCEILRWELTRMELLVINKYGAKETIEYAGKFEMPKEIPSFKTRKPRFCFFSGNRNLNPRTIALIKFHQMPYTNQRLVKIFGRKVPGVYGPANVRRKLWVPGEEYIIRYKVIPTEVGMVVFEPREPLEDGLYGIDSGRPLPSGKHERITLSTSARKWGLRPPDDPPLAIFFIIGDRKKIEKLSERITYNKEESKSTTPKSNAKSNNEISVDSIKQFFSGLLDAKPGSTQINAGDTGDQAE